MSPCFCQRRTSSAVVACSVGRGPSRTARGIDQPGNHGALEPASMTSFGDVMTLLEFRSAFMRSARACTRRLFSPLFWTSLQQPVDRQTHATREAALRRIDEIQHHRGRLTEGRMNTDQALRRLDRGDYQAEGLSRYVDRRSRVVHSKAHARAHLDDIASPVDETPARITAWTTIPRGVGRPSQPRTTAMAPPSLIAG